MRIRSAIATLLGVIVSLGVAAIAPAHAATDRFFSASDGVALHYKEAGQGQTIVFVPGWTMPAWIWDAQMNDFARRYHVVAFDPRSQGQSGLAASGHEPGRRGQDIAELLAQLGPAPVLLVGWSLGVLDSLAYVHSHGDSHLAGLVLVDNSVGEDPPPSPSHEGAAPRGRRRLTREETMHNFVASMFRRPQPPGYIDRLTDTALRTPQAAAAALLSYPVPRTYWREAIYSVTKPVLYIVRPGLTGQALNLQARDPVADPGRFDAIMQSFIGRRIWR